MKRQLPVPLKLEAVDLWDAQSPFIVLTMPLSLLGHKALTVLQEHLVHQGMTLDGAPSRKPLSTKSWLDLACHSFQRSLNHGSMRPKGVEEQRGDGSGLLTCRNPGIASRLAVREICGSQMVSCSLSAKRLHLNNRVPLGGSLGKVFCMFYPCLPILPFSFGFSTYQIKDPEISQQNQRGCHTLATVIW